MVFPPVLTADIPVDSSKETFVFQGPYSDKAMYLIWRYILLLPNEIHLFLNYLKE